MLQVHDSFSSKSLSKTFPLERPPLRHLCIDFRYEYLTKECTVVSWNEPKAFSSSFREFNIFTMIRVSFCQVDYTACHSSLLDWNFFLVAALSDIHPTHPSPYPEQGQLLCLSCRSKIVEPSKMAATFAFYPWISKDHQNEAFCPCRRIW